MSRHDSKLLAVVLIGYLAVGLVGCRHNLASDPTGRPEARGYFVRPDGPSPFDCQADSDCQSGPGVNPENGCCDTGVHNSIYSREYLEWRANWVREHCRTVRCPILPPPAPVLPCGLVGRCQAGRCRSACP